MPAKDKIVKDKNGHLVIGGGNDFTITKKEFDEFKDNISAIRQKFISTTKNN